MSKHTVTIERRVRIELLRSRAEIERYELCKATEALCNTVQPANLVNLAKEQVGHQLKTSFGPQSAVGGWVALAGSIGKNYPLLSSGVSALLGSIVGKKQWRFGALALSAWRLYSAWQQKQQKKEDKYVQPSNRESSRLIGPLK